MVSIKSMIDRCHGMVGTSDLNEWETKFIGDLKKRSDQAVSAGQVYGLTEKQSDSLESIYNKHFGDSA